MAIETAEKEKMIQALLQARFHFLTPSVLAAVDAAFNAGLEPQSERFATEVVAAIKCANGFRGWASDPDLKRVSEIVDQGIRYEEELQALNYQSVRRAYDQMVEREGRRRDGHAFFTHPKHKPDFHLWNQKSKWTVEEAVALSLDKEPTTVNLKSLSDTSSSSPFKKEYASRLDVLRRRLGPQADGLVAITEFVALLKPDFSMPPDFGFNDTPGVLAAPAKELEAELYRLREENIALKAEILELKKQPDDFDKHKSMRKLIYCIAVDKFRLVAGRSSATRHIEDCIKKISVDQNRPGLILSTNTIKSILDNAVAAVDDKAAADMR